MGISLIWFTIPIHVAIQHDIKIIFWGENPQFEYGGPKNESEKKILDYNWLQEFGGLNGLRVSDLEGQENITLKDLDYYFYPDKDLLNNKKIAGHYLGYYVQWDSLKNREISKKKGFQTWETNVEGAILDCENLDNYQAGIHEYFCFLKFGFSRATAQASMMIRRKELSRNEALKKVKDVEGKFPETFLGRQVINGDKSDLNNVLEYNKIIGLSYKETDKELFNEFKDNGFIVYNHQLDHYNNKFLN